MLPIAFHSEANTQVQRCRWESRLGTVQRSRVLPRTKGVVAAAVVGVVVGWGVKSGLGTGKVLGIATGSGEH